MVDIFNERMYIKNILKDGFSSRWQRDALLLARYYKIEGMSKSEIKDHLVEKCELYIPGFNMYVYYKTINKIIDEAWKNDTELRVIQQLEVDSEKINWFLNQNQLTEKEQRALFTIYGWSLIQSQYLKSPYWHSLSQYSSLFKESADIPVGTSLNTLKKKLCNLGYLKSSSNGRKSNGISKCILYAQFIEDNEILTSPVEEQNKITISYDDMYKLGNFLERYRKAGIKGIKNKKNQMSKVDKIQIITCSNCGEEFAVSPNNKRTLCDKCYKEYRKKKVAENKKNCLKNKREKQEKQKT